MFSLFFVVFIWIVIVVAAKNSSKSREDGKKSSGHNNNSGGHNNSDYEVRRTYANDSGSQSRRGTANSTAGNNVAKSRTGNNMESTSVQSTTEMLRRKAMQDEKEHVMETRKQQMENKRHYRDLNYAGRYMLGDPVPQSRKIIICNYCNAENLVPQNDNPGKYNCYFCREKL